MVRLLMLLPLAACGYGQWTPFHADDRPADPQDWGQPREVCVPPDLQVVVRPTRIRVSAFAFDGEVGMDVRIDGVSVPVELVRDKSYVNGTYEGPLAAAGSRVEVFTTTTCEGRVIEQSASKVIGTDCDLVLPTFEVEATAGDGEVHVDVTWDAEAARIYGGSGVPEIAVQRSVHCVPGVCGPRDVPVPVEVTPGPTEGSLHGVATPGSSYEVSAQVSYTCGGRQRLADRLLYTGTITDPVADPSDLAGAVYGAPGDRFRLRQPFIMLLQNTLHMNWLPMLLIDSVDPAAGEIGLTLAWTDPDANQPTQKACTSTTTLPMGTFTNPGFRVGPADLEVLTGMGSTRLYDFEMVGAFGNDGAFLGDVEFTGSFDLRDLAWEMGFDDATDVCLWADEVFSAPCTACPDGEVACMPVHVDNVFADEVGAPVTVSDDACGISDHDSYWDSARELIYTTLPGSSTVEALDYDGVVQWATPIDAVVLEIALETNQYPHHVLVVVEAANGALGYRLLDRDDGHEAARGAYTYPPPPDLSGSFGPIGGSGSIGGGFGGGGLGGTGGGGFSGFGGGGASCSVVSIALGTLPWFALLPPMFGLALRRRKASSGSAS